VKIIFSTTVKTLGASGTVLLIWCMCTDVQVQPLLASSAQTSDLDKVGSSTLTLLSCFHHKNVKSLVLSVCQGLVYLHVYLHTRAVC
jgi:hypothetical protein